MTASISNLNAQDVPIEKMLKSYVESYKTDHMAHTATFGIKIGDNEWWYVTSKRKQSSYVPKDYKQFRFHKFGPHKVTLHKGKPTSPTWYFHFANKEVLSNIYQKIWTAASASAKSYGSDIVGLNIRDMENYKSGIKEEALSYEIMEHFWKKDTIEITYFSRDGSLPTHGVDYVGLYTMKDKRIGWFSIGPEQVANAERGLDAGQVPNLFIITKGKGRADLGDKKVDLKPGMSIFIGPYVKHVIYNPYKEPLEGILVLFGDNSDYIWGNSYLDLLEQQHNFYYNYQQSIKKKRSK